MEYTPENANRISELAHQNLRRFVRDPEVGCKNSLLLRNGCFCGLKFSSGPFHAHWIVGEDEIHFFRNLDLIYIENLGDSNQLSKAA